MTTEMQQFWETRDRLMRTGSVERMETFLTQWQQKMETKGNFLDWASVTNEKGLFYRKIGLFEESISVMESLRKALLKERGRHSPEYASLLNNLGGTYRKMGDKDTAIALFEESLAIYKAQARLNVSVCASLYLNLSQVYQEKGELEKAAKRLEESLSGRRPPRPRPQRPRRQDHLQGGERRLRRFTGRRTRQFSRRRLVHGRGGG